MKLIRYYDGSEELYDLKADPNEFNNIVAQDSYRQNLKELRTLVPVDKRFKQMVRYGKYKGILGADGNVKVYDMLHAKSGIGEHTEVSVDKPEIVNKIKAWFASNPDLRHGILK